MNGGESDHGSRRGQGLGARAPPAAAQSQQPQAPGPEQEQALYDYIFALEQAREVMRKAG